MIYVSSIEINHDSITIVKDKWYSDIDATVLPSNATYKNVYWYSSDTKIVTVNSSTGHICGKCIGSARIYAVATDGSGACDYCAVTVTENKASYNKTLIDDNPAGLIDVTKKVSQSKVVEEEKSDTIIEYVTVSPEYLTIYVGTYIRLSAYLYIIDGYNCRVYWYSEDSSIVEVNSNTGEIYAKAVGTVKVWAVSAADVSKSDCCTIEVKPEFIQMEKLTILQSDIIMFAGESIQLTANICPENATNRILNWSSTDINVVKVDSEGFITALCSGEVLILVRATDGSRMQNYCRVTVLPIKE